MYGSDYNESTHVYCTIFTITKLWKQDAPQLMNGLRKCGIYIELNFIQPQRRMKFCHFPVMDGTGEHHLKLLPKLKKLKGACFL
jgi:hypothetical protein